MNKSRLMISLKNGSPSTIVLFHSTGAPGLLGFHQSSARLTTGELMILVLPDWLYVGNLAVF